jgi:hypothetical protein
VVTELPPEEFCATIGETIAEIIQNHSGLEEAGIEINSIEWTGEEAE